MAKHCIRLGMHPNIMLCAVSHHVALYQIELLTIKIIIMIKEKSLKEKEIAIKLWDLLDDIDTASDIFKPSRTNGINSYHQFYEYVMKKSEERHKFMKSDGYELYSLHEFEKLPKQKECTAIIGKSSKLNIALICVDENDFLNYEKSSSFNYIMITDKLQAVGNEFHSVQYTKKSKFIKDFKKIKSYCDFRVSDYL